MRRGTTPTYTLKFPDLTFSQIEDVCLAFVQNDSTGEKVNELYLHASDGEITIDQMDQSCYVTLTAEQTSAFNKGKVKRQTKVKLSDGTILSGDIEKEDVYDELHEESF